MTENDDDTISRFQRAIRNGHNGPNGDSAGAASAQVGGTPKTRTAEHEPKWVERRTRVVERRTSKVERRTEVGGTADQQGGTADQRGGGTANTTKSAAVRAAARAKATWAFACVVVQVLSF